RVNAARECCEASGDLERAQGDGHRQPRGADGRQQATGGADGQRPREPLDQEVAGHAEVEGDLRERVEVQRGERGPIAVDVGEAAADGAAHEGQHEMPLVMEANRLWRGLQRELGADIEWVQGGNLALAADDTRMARLETWLPVAREFGLETRLLRARELDAVVPGLAGGWVGGMHTPGDGHADPEKTTDAFARAALAHGASLHLECAV